MKETKTFSIKNLARKKAPIQKAKMNGINLSPFFSSPWVKPPIINEPTMLLIITISKVMFLMKIGEINIPDENIGINGRFVDLNADSGTSRVEYKFVKTSANFPVKESTKGEAITSAIIIKIV